MEKNNWLIAALLLPVISGCFRLDGFFYTPEPLEEYQLEDYQGEAEIREEVAFIQVPQHRIHQFSLKSVNGNTIYAVFVGDTSTLANQNVILYCHGRADHMDNYWPRAKLLWYALQKTNNKGSVLMFDYQGFGRSEGEATEQALYDDTYTMYQWLKGKGATDAQISLYGYSLGSAPATKLAWEQENNGEGYQMQVGQLILEAPFASAEVFAQDATQLVMPGPFVTNLKINNAAEIREVNVPFLWIHGEEDDFISIETHGEVVYKNYDGIDGTAIRVQGGHHTDLPSVYGIEAYAQKLKAFIKK